MRKILLISLGVAALFASEAASGHTDIVPRTINFIIFVALLWYLVGDKIKNYLAQNGFKVVKYVDNFITYSILISFNFFCFN